MGLQLVLRGITVHKLSDVLAGAEYRLTAPIRDFLDSHSARVIS